LTNILLSATFIYFQARRDINGGACFDVEVGMGWEGIVMGRWAGI
jgi:hypothetical protein